jgi:uncharacterized protein YecT (DUF1311 family)
MRASFFVSIVPIACAMASSADAQSGSTYQNSCKDVQLTGVTLSATCRRVDGSFNETSISVRGIDNIDGVLKFSSTAKASTFQNSCTDIEVAGRTLSANCRRIDGTLNQTSISIPGIENIDGVLRYQSSQASVTDDHGPRPPSWCVSQSNLNAAERTICDTQRLWELDNQLNLIYRSALTSVGPERARLQRGQEDWVRVTRDGCKDDGSCLADVYERRIGILRSIDNRGSIEK